MPVKHPKSRKTTYGPHKDIQKAINQAILATDYQPPLPDLDYETWRKAFDWNGKRSKARNNILEWVGDSLMDAAISLELYRQVPEGNQHIFTVVRPPLVSNETFGWLMHKLNNSRALVTREAYLDPTSKLAADTFEVVAAEVFMNANFETFRAWVGRVFRPLIQVATETFLSAGDSNSLGKRKRVGESDEYRVIAPASGAGAEAVTSTLTADRPCKRLKQTHGASEINITSLSATQGSSEAGRTLTPMPDVQHSHNRTMATTTTKTLIRGPGSSRNNPIVIVDSDPEDTAECVSPSLSLSARNNPIIIADSDLEDASSDNSPSSDDLEEPSELNDKSSR